MVSADGDSAGHFSVGIDNGLVTVARPLDREVRHHFILELSVTDGQHSTAVQVLTAMTCFSIDNRADASSVVLISIRIILI
jgi:hypothetical protein